MNQIETDYTIDPEDCVAGRWYESKRWGRVLCCGNTTEEWLPAFAIHLKNGRTEMRYFSSHVLLRDCPQCWEDDESNSHSNGGQP